LREIDIMRNFVGLKEWKQNGAILQKSQPEVYVKSHYRTDQ
jgi:hypothetical protein